MSRPQARRRRIWQGGALAVVATVTVALAQNTTTAAFTAQTGDTGNQVTAKSSFCVSPGSTVLTVATDAASNQDAPTTSYGTNTTIGVASGPTANAHTYLKFSLAAQAPLPNRCRVTGARLAVYATGSAPSRTLQAFRASTAWTGAVTWNTAGRPAPAGTAATTGSLGAAGWQEWDVTVLTRELYTGPDYGFLLKDANDNAPSTQYQYWASLESGSNPAKLTITWG